MAQGDINTVALVVIAICQIILLALALSRRV